MTSIPFFENPDIMDFSTTPVEDLLLAVLRDKMPNVPVYTELPLEQWPDYCISVRGTNNDGYVIRENPRLNENAPFIINAFTRDPNGDEKGARLARAVWAKLLEAAQEQKVYPGLGWIRTIRVNASPARKSDYSTSVGPVQYADLPTGYWRYETKYRMTYKSLPPL